MTPRYASPELTNGTWRRNLWAVDVWGVGIMLLEIITGQDCMWDSQRGCIAIGDKTLPSVHVDTLVPHRPEGAYQEDAASLCCSLLALDPQQRPTAQDAMLHSFIRGVHALQQEDSLQVNTQVQCMSAVQRTWSCCVAQWACACVAQSSGVVQLGRPRCDTHGCRRVTWMVTWPCST